jgi:hypothetical protein
MKKSSLIVCLVAIFGLLVTACAPTENAPAEGGGGAVSTAPMPGNAEGAKAGGSAAGNQAAAAMQAQADAMARAKAGGK